MPDYSNIPTTTNETNGKQSSDAPTSVIVHKHTCRSCGAVTEDVIPPEQLYQAGFHPALRMGQGPIVQSPWHAVHSQSITYTWNVLLVAIVIFMTFFAARYLFR